MELEISQLDRKYEGLRIQSPAQLGHLVSSLAKHGQKHPVLVVAAACDRYVLIDGYRRAAALGVLGRDLIEAVVLEASEIEALVMSQKLDGRRRLCALEEGWFLRELVCGHGLARTELARLLERSPSWVSRRLALVDVLPEPAQQAVRRGQLSPHAAMKVLVPLARANASACIKLVESLGSEPWSVRQMERLYRDWRRGDREARERIVSHPELYRKVDEEQSEGDDDSSDRIARDLGILIAVSGRLGDRVEAGELETLPEARQKRVARAWAAVRYAFSALETQMEERLARSGNPDSDLSPAPGGPRGSDDCPGAGNLAQRGSPGAP